MKRLNLYLPDVHYDWLETQSKKQGVAATELVRQALDAFIKAHEPEERALFQHSPGTPLFSFAPWRGDNSKLSGSIRELQQVVALMEQALRATASRDTLATFDAALAALHAKNKPVSPLDYPAPTPPEDAT